MKVIAINGSPRKNGNVTRCLEIMEKELDLDGRGCVRLEEAMDCLLNAISIMKDEVENEKARW